jgi:hypothetical protein|tara:strand:+ start:90 stop:380 length:291 start_codon:yes stop_codon:yes gene_type:complete
MTKLIINVVNNSIYFIYLRFILFINILDHILFSNMLEDKKKNETNFANDYDVYENLHNDRFCVDNFQDIHSEKIFDITRKHFSELENIINTTLLNC